LIEDCHVRDFDNLRNLRVTTFVNWSQAGAGGRRLVASGLRPDGTIRNLLQPEPPKSLRFLRILEVRDDS
jgi:hypothetical protein